MTDKFLHDSKISWKGLVLSPFILFLGFYFLTVEYPPSFIWLFLSGSLSLILMFGTKTYKTLTAKMKKNNFHKIIKWTFISFIASLLALYLGKLIFSSSSTSNPIISELTKDKLTALKKIATIWISLIGEEVFIAAVFFPILYLLHKKLSKKWSIWIAILVSSLFFGALHLPTYSWNWYQSIVVIGLTRIPFTLLWIDTGSLRGGFYAHILFDYIIFIPVTLISFFT